MSLLKEASNQTAYLKAGILGFQGSGKTFTASRLASGLAKLSNKENPRVAFFDTEKGSDFLVDYFKKEGIKLDVAKTRAFSDLLTFMREVETEKYDVAIIDSITHVWTELTDSYVKRLNRRNGLLFQDWGVVKKEWRQFTDLFINTKIHTIVLGRAGYEYDMTPDESGKNQLIKTGIKMKAEGEFGYESDVLFEMERVQKEEGRKQLNRCYVIKDRTDTMNGKIIDMPKFEDFMPIIKHLNIGGQHVGVNTDRNSEHMFADPDYSYAELQKQRDIALEELNQELVLQKLSGTAQETVKARTEKLIEIYGTSSKTALENMHPDQLREGINKLKLKKSAYITND